jgi:hypothetical protein
MLAGYYFFLIGALRAFLAPVAIVTIAIAVVVRSDEHRPLFSPGELVFALGWLLRFAPLVALMIVVAPGSSAPQIARPLRWQPCSSLWARPSRWAISPI